jgi:hypothetical protein
MTVWREEEIKEEDREENRIKAFEDTIKEYGFNYSEMLRTNPNNDPKGLHVFYDNVIREAAMHKIRQRGLLREGEE